MPWNASDNSNYKYVQKLSAKQTRAWVKTANATFEKTDSQEEAIRIANSQAALTKDRERGNIMADSIKRRNYSDILRKANARNLEVFRHTTDCIFTEATNINEETGTIENTVMITPVSKNGRTYSEKAMDDIVRLGKDTAAFDGHSMWGEGQSIFSDLVGHHTNLRKTSEGNVLSDFKPMESRFSLMSELAKKRIPKIGFSLVSYGESEIQKIDGKPFAVITKVEEVESCDLVHNPATTKTLFEYAGCAENTESSAACGFEILTESGFVPYQVSIDKNVDDFKNEKLNEKETDDMEWENITLEELKTKRPDLVETVTNGTEMDKVKAVTTEQAKEIEALNAKIAEHDKEAAERAKVSLIEDTIAEEGKELPDAAKTSIKTRFSTMPEVAKESIVADINLYKESLPKGDKINPENDDSHVSTGGVEGKPKKEENKDYREMSLEDKKKRQEANLALLTG